LRAVWIDVNDGAVRSTGSLQLVDTDESAAYLRTSYAIVELSRDLTIAGLDEGEPSRNVKFKSLWWPSLLLPLISLVKIEFIHLPFIGLINPLYFNIIFF
jgi:hypothetical protein